MKTKNILMLPILFFLLSCSGGINNCYYEDSYYGNYYQDNVANNDEYLNIKENDYISPIEQPTSSFSLDSSGAAYSNIRKYLNNNKLPEFNQVIMEQMINYFDYDYQVKENEDVSLFSEVANCPWNSEAKLASIAVKTKKVEYSSSKGNNYVLLIDVSGSMYLDDKLPLLKKGFSLLVDKLSDKDKVSIVTYSGAEKVVLSGVNGSEKSKIKKAISTLEASDSTNGQRGIQTAYKLAKDYFIEGGINQILLATDGDFNVGISSPTKLKEMVKEELQSGISLSCFGFGYGNYKDNMMQELALNGNGNVFYIDGELEMTRIFNGDISSILQVVAKDAKIQVEFNQEKVNKYRLIGYENRLMSNEEFKDENKDAGEIYSNKTTIALYEIISEENDDLFSINFKYKDIENNETQEIKMDNNEYTLAPSKNHVFASLVAEFGLLLRNSQYKGTSSYTHIKNIYNEYADFKNDMLKNDFYSLVCKAQELSQKE
mgnify:CR=1 FL=1